MIKKIIATEQRQAYYDSDYWYNNDDAVCDDIIVAGNNYFVSLNPDLLNEVFKTVESIASDFDTYISEHLTAIDNPEAFSYKDIPVAERNEFICYAFTTKTYEPDFSDADVEAVTALVSAMKDYSAKDAATCAQYIAPFMSYMTGKTYDYNQISGCSQSEWQYVFYPVENAFKLDYIDAVYFGTGTEYEVNGYDEDDNAVYDEPEQVYQQWMPDSQRKERFKQYFHPDTLAPEVEVVIREIIGTRTTVTYDYKDR